VEETSVLRAASNSAQKLLLPDETTFDRITPHVDSISGRREDGSRISAVGLIHRHTTGGCGTFAIVLSVQDDAPIVRQWRHNIWKIMVRNAVQVRGRSTLEAEGKVVKLLMPLYESLRRMNSLIQVRLQTTENLCNFGKRALAEDPFEVGFKLIRH
jgi:hypothetical protein